MKSKKAVRTLEAVYDIVIIGAGPAGLCCACTLEPLGLKTLVLEQQPETAIAQPGPDGRDIALTHGSRAALQELGLWQSLPEKEISPIREARVLDGESPFFMQFREEKAPEGTLGWLVPNHLIRKAAYDAMKKCRHAVLRAGISVKAVQTDVDQAQVVLETGAVITAKLVVAADSRFSAARTRMGIPADVRDFGRSVIVCRMAHEKDHQQTAFECFHYGRTLAVLPLNGNESSIVITLPTRDLDRVKNMDPAAFAEEIAGKFGHRLGRMRLVSERYSYPLAAVYADRFHAVRFALVGDAAVGMHPVTAHGFNFGLSGAITLAQEIGRAAELGLDIGAKSVLENYNRKHRRKTRPLYLATNTLVALYTNDRPVARLARAAVLRLGQGLLPARKFISGRLTDKKAS